MHQNQYFKTGTAFLFCLVSLSSLGQREIPQEYIVLYPLQTAWQVYDGKYRAFVPYLASRHGKPSSVSVWVMPSRYPRKSLIFYAYPDTYLFINQKMVDAFEQEGWRSYSLDSLQRQWPGKALFCTFYDQQQRLPLPHLFIGLLQSAKAKASALTNFPAAAVREYPAQERVIFWWRSVLTMGVLLGLSGYAFLMHFAPGSFWSYVSGRSRLSSVAKKDENIITRPLHQFNFFYLLLMSLWGALYYLIVLKIGGRTPLPGMPFGLLLVWIGSIFALLWGKYLILVLFGALLNVTQNVVQTHFFEFNRGLGLYYGAAGLGLSLWANASAWGFPAAASQIILYLTLAFHLFLSAMVSYYVIKQSAYKSLYLFYYLCIAELIPLLVCLKLLFFNIYNPVSI